MRKFAEEVSRLVHSVGKMDAIAVKVASEVASVQAQGACAQVADGLYDVMLEKAAEECDGDVCKLVVKMAQALALPEVSADMRAKIAAADAVDTMLRSVTPSEKVANMRRYGREFISELLREVL